MSKIPSVLRNSGPKFGRFGVLAMAVIVVASELVSPVFAINNYGPDGNDFSAFDRVYMVVSQGGGSSLDAPYSKVYAYAPAGAGGNQTVRLTLVGGDHCYDGNGSALGVDSSAPTQTSGSDTNFKFSTPTGTVVTHNNSIRYTPDSTSPSGCNTDQQDFYINVNDGDRPSQSSGLHGYYKIAVEATMNNNGVNAFKVILPNGGVMSYTDSSGDKFALQQRVDRNWIRSDFNVYFATPCDATGFVTAQLKWFDADQGQYNQSPSTFGYRLYQRARGSNGSWTQIVDNTNVGGNGVAGDAWYDFYKNQEYKWEWYGVSPQNGIQFQVPFDSAYAAVSCEGGDFQLNPVLVSANPSIVTPSTNTVDVTARVDRSGSTPSFNDEEWRVTKFIVAPGGSLSGGGTGSEPCNQFGGYVACNTGWSAGGVTFSNNSTTIVNNGADTVDHSLQPGTKICYVASVSKWSTGDPSWRHSNVVCSTYVQIPFAYIRGNDLRVGSGFSVANNKSSLMSGYVTQGGATWAEYGVLAPGTVSGVASQSGAVNGGSGSNQNAWSKLTFANTGGSYGNFASAASMGAIPNVRNILTSGTFSSFELRDKGAANVTISGELTGPYSTNNFKKSVVIVTTGTVTIDTDIKYTSGTLVGKKDMPQLVIIANNINILDNVKQVDAWLVASGTVNTCSNIVPNAGARSNLRSTNCNTALSVNGPIMASQLLLARTYYDTTKKEAAENLNMRGDAYVWADQVSRDGASWHTTYTTDLPPRY